MFARHSVAFVFKCEEPTICGNEQSADNDDNA
jgi:hypothetical protein